MVVPPCAIAAACHVAAIARQAAPRALQGALFSLAAAATFRNSAPRERKLNVEVLQFIATAVHGLLSLERA